LKTRAPEQEAAAHALLSQLLLGILWMILYDWLQYALCNTAQITVIVSSTLLSAGSDNAMSPLLLLLPQACRLVCALCLACRTLCAAALAGRCGRCWTRLDMLQCW
jgi:hypothetical protein